MVPVSLRVVLISGQAGGRKRNSETERRRMKKICEVLGLVCV